jgi:hypothetical protein
LKRRKYSFAIQGVYIYLCELEENIAEQSQLLWGSGEKIYRKVQVHTFTVNFHIRGSFV